MRVPPRVDWASHGEGATQSRLGVMVRVPPRVDWVSRDEGATQSSRAALTT